MLLWVLGLWAICFMVWIVDDSIQTKKRRELWAIEDLEEKRIDRLETIKALRKSCGDF